MKIKLLMMIVIIAPLVLGFLLGLLRGSRRAILRLILVILCVAATFAINGAVSDKIMTMPLQDGQTLEQMIVSQLPAEYESIAGTLVPVVALVVTAISFILVFLVIKFISWLIIFPICKIFVKKARKKDNGEYGNKDALIGGIVGVVQGGVVALVLCVMINGLLYNVGNLAASASAVMADDGGGGVQIDESGQFSDGSSFKNALVMLEDYKDSNICQTLKKAGGEKMFDLVVRVKTEDGKTLTLTGQIDALNVIVRSAKSVMNLSQNLGANLDADLAESIKTMFDELDDLSEESRDTVNNILQTAASAILPDEMNLDFSNLNFADIDFKHEGSVLSDLASYKGMNSSELTADEVKTEAENIVNLVIESDIILPVLSSSSEFTAGLSDEHKNEVAAIIDELAKDSSKDANKIDMLRKFFGLNDGTE